MLYTELAKLDTIAAKAYNDNLIIQLSKQRDNLLKLRHTKCARECSQIINRLRKRNTKLTKQGK